MAAHRNIPRIIPKYRINKEQKLLYIVIAIQIINLIVMIIRK